MSSVRFKSYKMITHIKRSMPWIPEYLKCWIYKLWHTQGPPKDLWWPNGSLMYLGAAFGCLKDPWTASGRLKVAFP